MDILTVDPSAQAPDIDGQNALIIWLLAFLARGPYQTLGDAKNAIAASDWLTSLQTDLTAAKAAIPAPVVVVPDPQAVTDPALVGGP